MAPVRKCEPGFQGVLSCPLHNISSDAVHIRLGDPFAKMDFAKTSGLRRAREDRALKSIKDEEGLYAAALASRLPGSGNNPVRLFKSDKRWREPIFAPGYAGQKLVKSSVKRIELDVAKSKTELDAFGDEVHRLRRFGLASAVAIVLAIATLLLALAQLDRSYTDSKVEGQADEAAQARAEQDAANSRVARLESEIARLRVQLAEVRDQVEAAQGR